MPEPDAPVITDDFNLGKEEHIPVYGSTVGDRVQVCGSR